MTEGIGKALASAIKDGNEPVSGKHTGLIFQNQHRRDIFTSLTLNPCAGLSDIASRCRISPNTAEWHLGVLINAGYVVKSTAGRRRVFFPEGLITHEQAALFRVINNPSSGLLLRTVINKPGLSQTELAEELGKTRQWIAGAMTELVALGAVSILSDGSLQRHYPTRLLPEKAEDFYRQSKDFADYLVRKLSAEGGKNPLVVKRNPGRVVIEIGPATGRFSFEVGVNPYLTCLSC
ncbi:MAG: winged helix-turn-helix transcriptional regulator [Thermoplasmata archaeon]|nr:winged helix-turn-helix transcriptional regulator [Thermoplasmata archaeon]